MIERARIVEDGVTTQVERPPSRPSWLLGVVGFALGLGLGVVVVGPTAQDTGTTAVEVATTTVGSTVPPGVRGAIPEFPDAIVAIAQATGASFDHVLWPVDGEPVIRPMNGGQGVAIDANAIFFATAQEIPGEGGGLLSIGRFNDIRPVSPGVSSYVFHDSNDGALGFTVRGNSDVQIFTVHPNLVIENVTSLDSPEAEVAAWGDWGWAIQDGDRVVLLTPAGDQKDVEAGNALASHGSGWVFVTEGEKIKLVSAGGGVSLLPAKLNVGDVRTAAFSPDGDMVAVGGQRGAEVVDVEDGTVLPLTAFSTLHVAWSSDSRFVLSSSGAGMLVHDLGSGAARPVLRDFNLVAAGVIPVEPS
jgi:hypothetical protein